MNDWLATMEKQEKKRQKVEKQKADQECLNEQKKKYLLKIDKEIEDLEHKLKCLKILKEGMK